MPQVNFLLFELFLFPRALNSDIIASVKRYLTPLIIPVKSVGKVLHLLSKDKRIWSVRKRNPSPLQLAIQYFSSLAHFLIYSNFSAVSYSLCNCIGIPQAHFSNNTAFCGEIKFHGQLQHIIFSVLREYNSQKLSWNSDACYEFTMSYF